MCSEGNKPANDQEEVIIKKEEMEDQETPKSAEDIVPISIFFDNQILQSTPLQGTENELIKLKRKRKSSGSKSIQVTMDHSDNHASLKKERIATNGLTSPKQVKLPQVKSPAMIRAEEIQSSLDPDCPSFIKTLVKSHVARSFWIALPLPFTRAHLPIDTKVILEDENSEQFEVKYYANSSGLSQGWRAFALANKLRDEDVLVFHLLGPKKFKVYIVRAKACNKSLPNLDSHAKQNEAEEENKDRTITSIKLKRRRRPKSLPLTVVQKKNKSGPQSGNDSEEVGSEVFIGPESSTPANPFKEIKTFEDFHIILNGVCLDNELDKNTRFKYYELCKSRNMFIHGRILPGLSSKLIGGIIGEIVSLVDGIKTCKSTTSREEFGRWEKSLESFGVLGFDIGFISDRISKLLRMVFESEGALHVKKYMETVNKQVRTMEEICDLESRLVELKEAFDKFGGENEAMKSKAEMYERKFQDQVKSPW